MLFQLKTHIKFFDNSEANHIVAKSAEETEEFGDSLLGKKECCIILALTTYLVSKSADQIVEKSTMLLPLG